MKIKKGQWYFRCCHEDLYQAEEDFEGDSLIDGVFDTKNEAIVEIAAMWRRSNYPEVAAEVEKLLK